MALPITPYKVIKGIKYWKHFGTREFFRRLADRLEPEEVPYMPWLEQHRAKPEELKKQRNKKWKETPLISIVVPAYHTPERFLTQLLDSVQAQTYENWELCIADAGANEMESGRRRTVEEIIRATQMTDPRIRYEALDKNENISMNTNHAVGMAHGAYVAFLDHDDIIEPDALYWIARAITEEGADFIYTDEDKVTQDLKKYYQPHLKPDFNLDLLRSNNYITHFLCVRRSLAESVGLFRNEMNGAQDYDFIFRTSEKAGKIVHVPRILYHWRTHESSTADNPMSKMYAYEAGQRAIESHLRRMGVDGDVELLPDYGFYRVHYAVKGNPKISVIIPNKDHSEELEACLTSLLDTFYPDLEIIVVENNSEERKTFEYYAEIAKLPQVRMVRWKKSFNYSAINNYGVSFAKGEYLLFLNNDVRATISRDWLREMVSVCQRSDVGAVGAKLYYPDNRIQSAGIVVGIGGIAGSMFVDLPRGRGGYMHKANLLQDMSAVTAACMMMKKSVFLEVGGFTEELAVAFNDVDLCLKVREKGYRIVFDPYAELYHDESKTRGQEDTPEKVRRFQNEIEYMRSHWTGILKNGDPMYNPNLSLKKWNYSLKV